jgi:hypothetical protein
MSINDENEWKLHKFDELNNLDDEEEQLRKEGLIMDSMKKQIGNKDVILEGSTIDSSTISLDIESLRRLIFEKDKTIVEFQKEL